MSISPNSLTRRQHLQTLAGGLAYAAAADEARADNPNVAYGQATLPSSIRSRFIENVNGLKVHMLEAGFETPNRPCVLFLHGFPELAYSWRKVMVRLAEAGYHTVAPDQRGFGRTTGWDSRYDADLTAFSTLNMVRDALALVSALGYRSVDVVGHDAGSPIAAWSALVRPDVFRSVGMMSAPFAGPPSLPFYTANNPRPAAAAPAPGIAAQLAALPAPSQVLSDLLHDSRSRQRHAQLPAGPRPPSSAGITTSRAPTGSRTSLSSSKPARRKRWPKCPILCDGSEEEHGGDRGRTHADCGRDCRLPSGSPTKMSPSTHPSTPGPASRALCRATAAVLNRATMPSSSPSPAAPSTCPPSTFQVRATGASTRPPARPKLCAPKRAQR